MTLDLLFPPRCASCRASIDRNFEAANSPLCMACRAQLPWLPPGGCTLCGELFFPGRPRCPSCEAHGSPLDGCHSAVSFEAEAQAWIHRLKYPRPGLSGLDPAPLVVVREWMRIAAISPGAPRPAWVVPIPLHAKRLRQRGFNPAALLAQEIAKISGARLVPRALTRIRDTPSQTGLDRGAREVNMRGAFFAPLTSPYPATAWLIDDVVTTTATLSAAATALKQRGVETVVAICAARTPKNPAPVPAEVRPRA